MCTDTPTAAALRCTQCGEPHHATGTLHSMGQCYANLRKQRGDRPRPARRPARGGEVVSKWWQIARWYFLIGTIYTVPAIAAIAWSLLGGFHD